MTTGLGKGLENAMKDTDFEESELGDIHTPGEVFDWMSEKYQLMCREYLLALGWKHPLKLRITFTN